MKIIDLLLGRAEPLKEPAVTPADLVARNNTRIAAIDARVAELGAVPPSERSKSQWNEMDHLFDLRNAIRPGRPS